MRRSFDAGRVAAVGPVLADLVAQTRAVPGTVLLAAAPVTDATVSFQATVVLVGGGQVLSPEPPGDADAVLTALQAAPVTALALAPSVLDALMALPDDRFEELDLLEVQAVVCGGVGLTSGTRAAVDDRFGPDVLVDVLTTAATSAIGVRSSDAEPFALLDGVEARTSTAGRLEVRSPLCAETGWVPTGDRGRGRWAQRAAARLKR